MNPYLDPFEKRLIPKVQEVIADKVVTLSEFFDTANLAFDIAQELMDEWKVFNAADKQYLLDAAGELFDRFIQPIDIKRVPNWVENWIKPIARERMLVGLSEFIDRYVQANFAGGVRK